MDQVIITSLGKFGSKPRQKRFSGLGALVSFLKEHTKNSDIWRVAQKFALMLNLLHGNGDRFSQQHSKILGFFRLLERYR